ncbi:MAG: hypothetical protein FJZ96_08560 [Chloroflexi bacterium]|nr:hypothetical protein [Chloroflexota bacterium]
MERLPTSVPGKPTWLSPIKTGAIGIVSYLAFYASIYMFGIFDSPFLGSDILTWDDFLTNTLTILAAAIAAALATIVWKHHGIGERVAVVWFFLATGLWLWTLGEIIWAILNLTAIEVPAVSLADIPWLAGYICFSIALERQYALIYHPNLRARRLATYAIWCVVIAGAAGITTLETGSNSTPGGLGDFVLAFYVLSDLAIAIFAFLLVLVFRGGAMLRPWLGLFLFALADGLYAWLYESGLYAFSAGADNLPSLVADTAYVAAYLILAFTLLVHYRLLRGGLIPSPKTKQS